MNWDAIGAVGEIAGAAAVVVTLVYLARQIRHSNSVVAAQVYQERANTRMMLHHTQSDSEHLAPIMFRMSELGWPDNVEAVESLDGLDLYRFRQNQFASLVRFDNSYYQYRRGFLSDDAWELTKAGILAMAPTWERLGILETGSTQPFREEVRRILDRP
jgi:hypothetical protein